MSDPHHRKANLLISLVGIRFDRGIGEYIKLFLPHLCREFKDNLIIVANSDLPSELLQNILEYKCKLIEKNIPTPIFEQLCIPYIMNRYNIKYAYFPANTFPLVKLKDTKYIVTIHDLIFLRKDIQPKKIYQKIGKFYRAFVIKNGIKKVDTILANSYSTLNEIRNRFNIKNLSKDSVIYNPFCFDKSRKKDNSILDLLNLKQGNYLYTISGTARSKNLDFVLRAFSKLNYLNPYIKLVISGVPNKNDQRRYFELLNLLHIKDSVIFTDYINEEQKNSLIENSKAFIFLSKAEGFGRPIVEALLCGATVIASDIEVFREIGDKYIYYVNINNENCLVDLFKNFPPKKFSYEDVVNYLKLKFDVTVLSKKLIQKIYSAIGDQNG
jgi:glycosyltransferase involved in cell wall biosynthesis